MAVAGLRNPGGDGLFVFRVIEDEQRVRSIPVVQFAARPAGFHVVGKRSEFRPVAQLVVNARETSIDPGAAIHPENALVETPVAVGIVAHERSFAHAAERGEGLDVPGLGKGGGGIGQELVVQFGELVLAAREVIDLVVAEHHRIADGLESNACSGRFVNSRRAHALGAETSADIAEQRPD